MKQHAFEGPIGQRRNQKEIKNFETNDDGNILYQNLTLDTAKQFKREVYSNKKCLQSEQRF